MKHTTGKPGDSQILPRIYPYNAKELLHPSPAQIEAARATTGMTQKAAAELVHRGDGARWREWASGKHAIDLAVWELFLIKTGLRHLE